MAQRLLRDLDDLLMRDKMNGRTLGSLGKRQMAPVSDLDFLTAEFLEEKKRTQFSVYGPNSSKTDLR